MKETVESAIKELAEKVKKDDVSITAMQYSQAALNLAHALSVIEDTKNRRK